MFLQSTYRPNNRCLNPALQEIELESRRKNKTIAISE